VFQYEKSAGHECLVQVFAIEQFGSEVTLAGPLDVGRVLENERESTDNFDVVKIGELLNAFFLKKVIDEIKVSAKLSLPLIKRVLYRICMISILVN
jgi:hypothetical protein